MKTSIQILFVCFENVIKDKPYAILQGETSKKKNPLWKEWEIFHLVISLLPSPALLFSFIP